MNCINQWIWFLGWEASVTFERAREGDPVPASISGCDQGFWWLSRPSQCWSVNCRSLQRLWEALSTSPAAGTWGSLSEPEPPIRTLAWLRPSPEKAVPSLLRASRTWNKSRYHTIPLLRHLEPCNRGALQKGNSCFLSAMKGILKGGTVMQTWPQTSSAPSSHSFQQEDWSAF